MKQKITVFVAGVIATAGLVSATVHAESPTTNVTGVVTEEQVAVANAEVSVLCNGKTEVDTTDAHGSYLVSFAAADCPFGSTVKVTGQKDDKSGVASGTVQGVTTKLNLAIVNVSIPEYGLIGGIMAAGMGVGMIAFMRRRQANAQSF